MIINDITMLHWDIEGTNGNVEEDGNKYTFYYPCESTETCYPYIVHLKPGVYTFECYGGVGGAARIDGGAAASTSGTIFVQSQTKLYLYVGAKGQQYSRSTVFGGGGSGSWRDEYNDGSGGGSGGGAFDIRIRKHDLHSRIMVAAGGGGSEWYNRDIKGGDAGILQGSSGNSYGGVSPGGGGTQDSGGTSHQPALIGTFGYGGNSEEYYGSGGGGGYYGGGAGSPLLYQVSSGGGGSSYIAGYSGCQINKIYSRFTFFHTKIVTGSTQDPKIIIYLHSICAKCGSNCYLYGYLSRHIFLYSCFILCCS